MISTQKAERNVIVFTGGENKTNANHCTPRLSICMLFSCPGRMFANCGRARYNGARMCKAMGRACAKQGLAHVQSNGARMRKALACACAKQWLAHVQSNGVRMAMARVNGACAKQLGEHAQGNCVGMCKAIGSACA